MSDLAMPTIKILRINAIEMSHSLAEVAVRRLYHQVRVVSHLKVSGYDKVEACANFSQCTQPFPPVYIVDVNKATTVTSGGNVVESTRKFDPKRPCHPASIATIAATDVVRINVRTLCRESSATDELVFDCGH